jgi:hypothetical protein
LTTQAKPKATVNGIDVVDDARTTIGAAIGRLYALRDEATRARDYLAASLVAEAIGALENALRDADVLAACYGRGGDR